MREQSSPRVAVCGTAGRVSRRAGLALSVVGAASVLLVVEPARAELPSNEESAFRERGTWISPGDQYGSAARPVRATRSPGSARRSSSKAGARKVASLGRTVDVTPVITTWASGNVAWKAPESCLNSALRSVIANVAANYGSVTVSSTCRSRGHNNRVGGARHSHHLTGDAADIRVGGNTRAAAAYMRSAVGGFKHYGGGLFHIDSGPRRRW